MSIVRLQTQADGFAFAGVGSQLQFSIPAFRGSLLECIQA